MNSCWICLKEVSGDQKYSGYHNSCVATLLGSLEVSPFLPFDKKIFHAELSQKFTLGMSMSGVQKKLSLTNEGGVLSPTAKNGRFILKPTVDDFPEVSANEHLTMKIGELLAIQTPPCGLVQFQNGQPAYLVRRFDWTSETTKIQKEDMAQIFQLERDDKQAYKYSKSYEAVGNKIKEVTGNKLIQVYEFFRRVVFCFLCGNGDYHLKNISLQNLGRDGTFEGLTPNYDAVMTVLYFTEKDLALDLLENGELSEGFDSVGFLTKQDFVLLGRRIGLLDAAIEKVFGDFRRRIPGIKELILRSHLSAEMKERYAKVTEQRAVKLELIGGARFIHE
jgi:serine/threonine-protein kinase HipA